MSWLWGSSDSKEPDSLSKLDPQLREFLNKEAQPKVSTSIPSPPQKPHESSHDARPAPTRQVETSESSKPSVPPQSLYQDGRYAHLWKTYKPLAQIEEANKSESEKMNDVIREYNNRKKDITEKAMENCALEQWAVRDCYKNGSVSAKMTMCHEETQTLNRCIALQGKFLAALGFLTTERGSEREERLQMHADKLYHQMIEEEKEEKRMSEAKASTEQKSPDDAKAEAPPKTILTKENISAAMAGQTPAASSPKEALSATSPSTEKSTEASMPKWNVPPHIQKAYEERINKYQGAERALEIKIIEAERKAAQTYGKKYMEALDIEAEARHKRREAGKETVGDTIKRWWGWK